MSTQEPVFCVLVMIEKWLFPDSTAVAGVTLIATMRFMCVVFQVAGRTILIHFIFKRVFRMTVVACQLGVPAKQVKIGISNMIET